MLQVFSVEPKHIVAGSGTRAMMKGTGFDERTTARLGDYNDQASVFFDESTIGLEITGQYDPGIYRIIVHDGHGRYAALPDAVEVIWVPQISEVKPKIIYSAGEGARIEILGKFFTAPCSVRVGDRELEVINVTNHQQIAAQLKKESFPLPLGEQAVTVINSGGRSATLKRGVTVLPPPEVRSVEPNPISFGETVDLFLRGNHLEKGTRVWLAQYPLGEARAVSPECLRIEVTARPELSRRDLILELPQGPKITVLPEALRVQNSAAVFMAVDIFPDEGSRSALELLQQLTTWRLKRPLREMKPPKSDRKHVKNPPAVEVVLPVFVVISPGKSRLEYRGKPLSVGSAIVVTVNGHKLSGTIAAEPFALFTDDLLVGAQ